MATMATANWSTIFWLIGSVLASLALLRSLHALVWFLCMIWSRRDWLRFPPSPPPPSDTLQAVPLPVVEVLDT